MLKQQLLAKNLSAFVFVAAMFSSLSAFAQMANDGFSPRVVGAYRQVASLQSAVVWQEGPKPVFQTDDTTGRTSCVWNCPEVGETGQARMQEIRVMGRDERNDVSAYLTPAEERLYSSEGRIECPIPGTSDMWITSGFVSMSLDTVATASHAFFIPPEPGVNAREIVLNPNTCSFRMYDRLGNLRDDIKISFAKSRWSNPKLHGDRSQDLSAVKLSRRPSFSFKTLEVFDGSGLDNVPIAVVAHHNDVSDPKRPRIMRGKINTMRSNPFPTTGEYRLTNPARMFVSDVDTNHGTSGGMYVNESNNSVIGIHGGSSPVSSKPGVYNAANEFNYGVLFDMQFINDLESLGRQSSNSSI